MRPSTSGFTLIELTIVVAIVAILAAVALPLYQDYTIRAQLAEGLQLADGAKTALAEFYARRGAFPAANASAGLSATVNGSYVTGLDVATAPGQIRVSFGNRAHARIQGGILALSALTAGGSVAWTCKAISGIDAKYFPTNCRG